MSLSTVFVDYDNIYLSLKRKNEEAARRFAKDAPLWLAGIASGQLITSTNGPAPNIDRRIIMNRCYGNPVPRRNSADNSTDMNSFPFVRHHFLRAGFEVVDCPPLTAQLKNSADIRMVMDIRDYLNHDTYFDEFIILSGDADFTPLLHRLRAHARRTVIFANDYTAAPYTAISDGEVRESDLMALLLEGRAAAQPEGNEAIAAARLLPQSAAPSAIPSAAEIEAVRRDIVKEVVEAVRSAGQPVPLEALADRAVRNLGHERTVGTAWGGTGSFRELLLKALPSEIRLNEQPPYFVYDANRQLAAAQPEARPAQSLAAPAIALEPQRAEERREPQFEALLEPAPVAPRREPVLPDASADYAPARQPAAPLPQQQAPAAYAGAPTQASGFRASPMPAVPGTPRNLTAQPQAPQHAAQAPSAPLAPQQAPIPQAAIPQSPPPAQKAAAPAAGPGPALGHPPGQAQAQPRAPIDGPTAIQRSIARIHDACQAPPLSPPEYRALFDLIAEEITRNGLSGAQTLVNIADRASQLGIEVRRDDIRFVLDVISETDPWFEQGASAKLFAGRFRNFVVARCRSQGLSLSADELDLIDAWFAGAPAPANRAPQQRQQPAPAPQPAPQAAQPPQQQPAPEPAADRWWNAAPQQQTVGDRFGAADDLGGDEFPRIVRRSIR